MHMELLRNLEPRTIFASGLTTDDVYGVCISNTNQVIRWVAVRGGIEDWAIYVGDYNDSLETIKDFGCKLPLKLAKTLIGGTDEFFTWYRR